LKIIVHKEFPEEFKTIELYSYSDAHIGHPHCDRQLILKWRDEVSAKPNRYICGVGDYCECMTATSKGNPMEQTKNVNEQIADTQEILYPVRDRILGWGDGNHEDQSFRASSIRVSQQILTGLFGAGPDGVKKIDQIYAPDAYLMFLSFGQRNNQPYRKMPYAIYCRHFMSRVSTAPAAQMRIIDADAFIFGHIHEAQLKPTSFIRVDKHNNKTTQVEKKVIVGNSFIGMGGYGERAGMSVPSSAFSKLILYGDKYHITAISDGRDI